MSKGLTAAIKPMFGNPNGSSHLSDRAILNHLDGLGGRFCLIEKPQVPGGVDLNSDSKLGDNVVIEDGASLNGDIRLKNTIVRAGTTLKGDITLSDITVSGDMACSGDGKFQARSLGESAVGSRPAEVAK